MMLLEVRLATLRDKVRGGSVELHQRCNTPQRCDEPAAPPLIWLLSATVSRT